VGQEVPCTLTWKGRTSPGRAQLETDHLLFRGDVRLKLFFRDMTKVSAAKGVLEIGSREGKVAVDLGARAEKWADKILHPPTVLDKLGVKEGLKVSVLGRPADGFAEELAARVRVAVSTRPRAASDLLFLFAEDRRALARVGSLRGSLKPAGGIWVIYPKARKELTENDVLGAGRDAGLKDVKVARFSDTHTALKFVIPVSDR
jgi:hypothetical protein